MKRHLNLTKANLCTMTACIITLTLCSCRTQTRVVRIEDNTDPRHPTEEIFRIDASTQRGRIIEEANTWIGTPYRYGKDEKGVCADCSGFVMRVYLTAVEIALPRSSFEQSEFCSVLKPEEIKQGDLVFFATGNDSTRVSHVGIMIDNDRFIHASSKKGVMVSHMSNPYFTRHFICYGRVPGLK